MPAWGARYRVEKLRTKPVEIRALWDAGLRVFCNGDRKDLSTWDWLVRVVRHWPRMEEIVEERGRGPWIFMLNDATVSEFTPGWLDGK